MGLGLALGAALAAHLLLDTAAPAWRLLVPAAALGGWLPWAARPVAAVVPAAALAWFLLAPSAPATVLVVVDCLRADRLGEMPGLDALAARGVRVPDARAQSSWTRSAVGSLLTGRWPRDHGLLRLRPSPDRLADGVDTLAAAFDRAGITAAAFAEQAQLDPAFGLDRGFRHYRHHEGEAPRLLRHHRRWEVVYRHVPRFVYLHLLDAHHPYDAGAPLPAWVPADPRAWTPLLREIREGRRPLSDAERAAFSAAYDAELRRLDAVLAPVVAALVADGATVLLTADHGEAFGEHGLLTHGQVPWEELLAVPLVVWAPGLAPGVSTVDARQVDVAPTLLALAGAPPLAAADGRDLGPALRGGTMPPVPSYAEYADEHGHFVSVRLGDRKRLDLGDRRVSVDLAADPGETRPLPGPDPALDALLDAYRGPRAAGGTPEVDAGTWEALRRLGYVE